MTAHLEPSPLSAEVEYLRAEIASVMRVKADTEERLRRLLALAVNLQERLAVAEKARGK